MKVLYRKRHGRQRLRVATHFKPLTISDHDFRLALILEYNRTNKRVVKIYNSPETLEDWMETQDKVEVLKEIQQSLVKFIRSVEPDADAPDNGICIPTCCWIAKKIDGWFEDVIFDTTI